MPGRKIVNGEPYRYGYQGEFAETDEETGKPAFQLRLYDPRLGRWISPDPYGQFDSPYLAMGNSPQQSIDPDGGYCYDTQGNKIGCGNFIKKWLYGGENPVMGHRYDGGQFEGFTLKFKGSAFTPDEANHYSEHKAMKDGVRAAQAKAAGVIVEVTAELALLALPELRLIRGSTLMSVGFERYAFKSAGKGAETFIFRAPRAGTIDDIMKNGFRESDHLLGDKKIYFGEESVAAEYAKTGAFDSYLIKVKVSESFAKKHAFRYLDGSGRLEYRIPVRKIDKLNTYSRTKIGPFW